VAAATLVPSLVLTACRIFTPSARVLVMATAFVPFAVVGYAVAAAAWWLARRSRDGARRPWSHAVLAVALAGLVLHVSWLVPSYVGAHASGRPDLVVMTSNLRLGWADVTAVGRVAAAQHVDLLVVEEVTPTVAASMTGLRERFPYVAGQPAPGAWGTMVFSRYPLTSVTRLPVSKGTWQMRVQAPTPFWFVGVHTAQPLSDAVSWRTDHARLLAAARELHGAVLLAGDFNATLDLRPMRRLLGSGFSDAGRQANAGWQPTWPGDGDAVGSLPFGLGLMTLDHVLTDRDYSAISTSTYEVPYSDHRALVARLALR
jgi:endonuclease/exonuclease/phosphatase (EEP) superfamily protein YafD